MREEIEFRISEEYAVRHLPDDLGERLGETVRKVVLNIDDPWVREIGSLNRKRGKIGRSFFTSWNIRRYYSRREISKATAFHLIIKRVFEPAGEECGTVYDDTLACDFILEPASEMEICGLTIPMCASTCGVGGRQVSSLFLNGRRLPKRVDFAKTIAGEIIASRRVVDLFQDEGMTGAEFKAVRLSNKDGAESLDWFQLNIQSKAVELDNTTRFGSNPFDNDQYGRCPLGHLAGLNLLSECWLSSSTYDATDIVQTKQFVGVRRGLLRPERLLLVSPRLWMSFQERNILGCVAEVAHEVVK